MAVSAGVCTGVLAGDLRDNSEIGKLVHSCWTYWGHSGAPLFQVPHYCLVSIVTHLGASLVFDWIVCDLQPTELYHVTHVTDVT